MTNECYHCKYRRDISGDLYSTCVNPDPDMTGKDNGTTIGWFFYPISYEPTWKTKDCANFESKENPEKIT
jgi:hypothetical protein